MKKIQVRGVGTVAFPDEMPDDEIEGFLRNKFSPPSAVAEPMEPLGPPEPPEPPEPQAPPAPEPTPFDPRMGSMAGSVAGSPESLFNSPQTQATQAGRIFSRFEGTAPQEFRTPRPPRPMTQEDLAYGTGTPMMTEQERRIQAIKESRGKGDMDTEEFVREHPDTKYAIYGFMGPTDMPFPRLDTQGAERLFGRKIGGYVAGTQQGIADFADFMTSAPGIMIPMTGGIAGAAGPMGPVIHRTVAQTFAVDMSRHLPDQFISITDAIARGDKEEAARGIFNGAVTLGIIGHGAKQTFKPLPAPRPPGAEPVDPTAPPSAEGRVTYQVPPQLPPQQLGTQRLLHYLKELFVPGAPAGVPRPVVERPPTVPPPPVQPPHTQPPPAREPTEPGLEKPETPGSIFQRAFNRTRGLIATLYPAPKAEPGAAPTRPVWQQPEGTAAPAAPTAYVDQLRKRLAGYEETLAEDAKLSPADQFPPEDIKSINKKIKELKEAIARAGAPAMEMKEAVALKEAGETREVKPPTPELELTGTPQAPGPEAGKPKAKRKRTAKKKASAAPGQAEMALGAEGKKLVDDAAFEVSTPIDIVDLPTREGDPFARRRVDEGRTKRPGQFMGINPERGSIEIYPEEFRQWLEETAPHRRAGAVRARLWEEKIHLIRKLHVDPQAAIAYWNSLSRMEQMIEQYSYSKAIGEKAERKTQYGKDPKLWGDEALRRRTQQLMEMEPSEIAEAAGAERWTLKGLSVLETGIRGVREYVLRTEASKKGAAALDELLSKIQIAKSAVIAQQHGEDPGAFNRRGQGEFFEDMPEGVIGEYDAGEVRVPVGFKSRLRERSYFGDPYLKTIEREISPGVWVDNSIADVILNMNRAGFKTMFSDSGLEADHLPTRAGKKRGVSYMDGVDDAYVAFERLTEAQEKFIADAAEKAGFKVSYEWREGIVIRKEKSNQAEVKRAWDELNRRVNDWADKGPGAFNRRDPVDEPDFVPVDVYAEAKRRAAFSGIEGESVLTGMPEEFQKPSPYKELNTEFLDRLHQSYVNDTGRYVLQTIDMFKEYPEMFDDYVPPPKIKALHNAYKASLGGKLSSGTSRDISSLGWDAWKYLEGDKAGIHPEVMDLLDFVKNKTDVFTNIPKFYRGTRTNRMLVEEFVKEKVGDRLDPQQAEQVINDWTGVRREMFETDPDLAYWIEQELHRGYERPEAALEGPTTESRAGDLPREDEAGAFNRRRSKRAEEELAKYKAAMEGKERSAQPTGKKPEEIKTGNLGDPKLFEEVGRSGIAGETWEQKAQLSGLMPANPQGPLKEYRLQPEPGSKPGTPSPAAAHYLNRPIKVAETTKTGVSYDHPNFKDFGRWVRANVRDAAGVRDIQLLAMWEDAVWNHLLKATPERLTEWRSAMKLDKPEKEGGMGKREMTFGEGRETVERERQRGIDFIYESAGRLEKKAADMESRLPGLTQTLKNLRDRLAAEQNESVKRNLQTQIMDLEAQVSSAETRAKKLRERADESVRMIQRPAQMERELAGVPRKEEWRAGELALPRREAKTDLAENQQYRLNLIGAIAKKLVDDAMPHRADIHLRTSQMESLTEEIAEFKRRIAEAEKGIVAEGELEPLREGLHRAMADLERLEGITIDDLDFGAKSEEGGFREFTDLESASPAVITEVLKDYARRRNTDPQSLTRRLAVLEHKETGAVDVVTAYKDAKEGIMMVDPDFRFGKERPNARLASIMQRFKVIGSLLLKEPTQNLHQRFESRTEFMDRLGEDARELQEGRSYGEFAGEMAEQYETETRRQGIFEEEERPPGLTEQEIAEMRLSEERAQELEDVRMAEAPPEVGEVKQLGGAGAGPWGREARSLLGMSKGEIQRARDIPLTATEAKAVWRYLTEESRRAETPEEARVALRDLKNRAQKNIEMNKRKARLRKDPITGKVKPGQKRRPGVFPLRGEHRAVISALQKVAGKVLREDNNLTGDQAAEVALGIFYDTILLEFNPELALKGRAGFLSRILDEFGEADVPYGTKPERGGREISMPDPRRMPEFLRRRPQGVDAYGVGTRGAPERLLSPEEAAELQKRPVMSESKLTAAGELLSGKAERPYVPSPERGQLSPELERRGFAIPGLEKDAAALERWLRGREPGGQEYTPGAFNRRQRQATTEYGKMLLHGLITKPWNAYSQWMVDRLRAVGTPEADKVASTFNEIISLEKGFYGKLSQYLDPARKAAGGVPPGVNPLKNPKQFAKETRDLLKATKWANELKSEYPGTAVANVVDAMERRRYPAYADKLFDLARPANLETGKLYEMASPLHKRKPRFRASHKFQRNLNDWGYDWVRQGDTPLRRRIVKAIVFMNRKSVNPPPPTAYGPGSVTEFFNKWKEVLDADMPDIREIDRVNQDFARRYPRVPTHVLLPNGTWQPIIHADLFNYLEAAARRATHINAYRQVFPNIKAGHKAYAAMRESLANLNATDKKVLGHALRALQGTPTDNYSKSGFAAPGEPWPEVFRFVNNTVGNLMAKAVLTGQMFVQPGEVLIGSTPVFLGYKNYLEGLARISRKPGWKQTYLELERNGAVNRVLYDFSNNPRSPLRTWFKRAANGLSVASFQNVLNELQEMAAASTAKVVAERIVKKQLSPWEMEHLPATFKNMGFNQAEIGKLMAGDPILLNQFKRKAAAWLTTGNKSLAEGSPIAANRLVNSIFRFQSYPMMKANQAGRLLGDFVEGWFKDIGKGWGSPANKKARWTATKRLSRFIAANSIQGALTAGLVTMAYKGVFGGKIGMNEMQDDFPGFVWDSFLAAMGGPLYLVLRGMQYGGVVGVGEQLARSIFPYAIAKEIWDMSWGETPAYKDRNLFERIGVFIDKKVPGTRAMRTGMAMTGLGEEDRKLRASQEAFWRWRRSYYDYAKSPGTIMEEGTDFRKHMRRAVEALTEGDAEKYVEELSLALETGNTKEDIARSFRARKILRSPKGEDLTKDPDAMEALRQRIGDDALLRLQWYDMMLEESAEGYLMLPIDEMVDQ